MRGPAYEFRGGKTIRQLCGRVNKFFALFLSGSPKNKMKGARDRSSLIMSDGANNSSLSIDSCATCQQSTAEGSEVSRSEIHLVCTS